MAGARVTLKEIEDEINKSPLQEVKDSGKSFKDKQNITIEGFDFTVNKSDVKQCVLTDCENVTIRRCKFRDKSTLGVALNITGAKTKKVIVEYCIFENLSFSDDNGGEPLRLGNSQYSGCNFECTVRKCIFRNLAADPETISIKSAKNIVEDCYHINNASMITVRHGGLAIIRFNTFQGKGGIRLLGYGNKVHDNLFENNQETGKLSPIQVQNAVKSKDPNWTEVKTPSGNGGSSHAIYAQCVDNEIIANEFRNCKKKIFFRTDKELSPKNLKIDHTLPPPPAPEEPDKPEPEVPEQPEPNPPPESVENPPTHARLCQLGHDEEALVRIAIYVCRKHLDDVKPHMQDLLVKLRDMVKRGEIKLEEE
jgi:Chondroitinase B